MAHPQLPSQHGSSLELMKEKDPVQPAGPTTLQRAWAHFLSGVSYFSGDMKVFGKWMESKLTLPRFTQRQYSSGTLVMTE